MKFLPSVVLAVSIVVFGPGAAIAQEKLIIATEGAYPPFNNVKADGTLEGFDVDIARALCEEMKAECQFVTQDWGGMIPALQAGRFDAAVASMRITAERKEQVDFSDKYYNSPLAILVPKDSGIEDISKESLAKKTIGIQGSTTNVKYIETTYTDSDVKLYPSSEEYKLDIVSGRVDAVNDDAVVLQEWLKTPEGQCCKIVGLINPVPEIHGEGAGVAIAKGRPELKERFNAAIKAIRANGKYKEINDKYFSFDVYGD